ncbi:cysteine dioxygenase [Enterovibrio norvegicus]|uniref:Cysteine dioxygenase n=1 Tax=Enterovibrio norvegicus TaxID=188144 RepID=A0A2N7LH55_9GAMM|nr:cysteine dioxygenase family protein [Enterovibrio norvegicus]PMN64428.1 hypothetical protein BCT27_10740 [Enterovibrio norvegicus]PMN94815.1 hypothetical protein BCT23_01930 [Enterovibrio norvegicus]
MDITKPSSLPLVPLFDADYQFTFDELLAQLAQTKKPLSLPSIRFVLENLALGDEQISTLSSFTSDTYCRKRLFKNECCEILILSWLNGQRSKIHDHKHTSCGVRVLNGEATETTFDTAANGHIYATQSSLFAEGSVTASKDDDIHQISNLQCDNKPLVTLHIYSPPLHQFNIYSLEDGKVTLLDMLEDSWIYEI